MTEGAVRLFSTPSICGVSALFRSHTYSRYSVGGAGPGSFQFTWRQLGSSTRSWPAARPSLPRTPALRHTKPTKATPACTLPPASGPRGLQGQNFAPAFWACARGNIRELVTGLYCRRGGNARAGAISLSYGTIQNTAVLSNLLSG